MVSYALRILHCSEQVRKREPPRDRGSGLFVFVLEYGSIKA
jgi:hypothetical protein